MEPRLNSDNTIKMSCYGTWRTIHTYIRIHHL